MSESISSSTAPRNYGATGSSSSSSHVVPEVGFSNFSPTEFMHLEADISAIKTGTKQLDKMLKLIQNNQGQPNICNKAHEVLTRTNQCMEATSLALQRSTTAATQRGDKQQKLLLQKITDDFKDVVNKYSAVQNEIVVVIKNVNAKIRKLEQRRSLEDNEQAVLLQQQQTQQQVEQQNEIDRLADREQQLINIQKDLIDVNSIMQKLGVMVAEQRDATTRLETNTENAALDVEAARKELAAAERSRQSYRCKILILIIVAVIIGLIVTGTIISSFK